jgi:hypothetical protein
VTTIQLLLDENVSPAYRRELRRHAPELTVWRVGDAGAPATGTPDPQILEWCEVNGFILVTSNRHSMPLHLRDHLAQGRHVPGILSFVQGEGMGKTIEDVLIVVLAGTDDDVWDRIVYLPLP